jgi:hypothetical protein
MKSVIGFPVNAALGTAAGDTRFPLAAGPTNGATLLATAGSAGSPLVVVAADLAVRPAPPSSLRLNAATVHSNGAAAGALPLPPAPSHEDRADPSPLTTAGAAGGAVITGAAGLTGVTNGVDKAGKSIADDPVSAGVEVQGEDADNDDPAPEPLPDEPLPAAKVSPGC